MNEDQPRGIRPFLFQGFDPGVIRRLFSFPPIETRTRLQHTLDLILNQVRGRAHGVQAKNFETFYHPIPDDAPTGGPNRQHTGQFNHVTRRPTAGCQSKILLQIIRTHPQFHPLIQFQLNEIV